ncbi:type VII secretion protein EssB/YukC [Lentibacillus salicampi]|uniref:Type VII secretion protein EssB n=1 Tax=Lentibacillus salicampi TaxID=175306 RepID=A0A4Y9AAB9_9BACI|nr:type VII secretion protein EssB/YukC [Lentibacillus salicampi]TFJ91281.1 hypothetical protein E4U82_18485 [Lentibacillus salicampi]
MENSYPLKNGYIKEENDSIIYQIPKEQTNLIETEQLDELKKNDSLFFKYQKCEVDDKFVRIYYEKLQGYRSILDYSDADNEVKRQIAINLLSVEKLIGTQYTTFIHPSNIYADNKGNVKLAHRGIRSVLPTGELTVPKLLSDLKGIIIYLFTSYNLSEIKSTKRKDVIKENSFIKEIYDAASIKRLHEILNSKVIPEQKVRKKTPKLSLLSGVLIGVIAGVILLYAVKVVPMSEAADKQSEQEADLSAENEELQDSLDHSNSIIKGYEAAMNSDTEEAISMFENIGNLNENAELALLEQYLKLNTPESLEKAANMGNAYPLKVVEGLRELNNSDANQAILSVESDMPEVRIEKAWINDEYENVIEIYNDIQENERAKYLVARSYIEQENHKEAMKLGKELENNDIQIASLNLQKDEIKDDDDMDDDEKDDKIEELDNQIDDLK